VEYLPGTFNQYSLLDIRYNGATNEWLAKGAPVTATIGTNSLSYSDLTNVGLTVGEVANVLTVNLKTLSGADASISNPINIPFADPAGGGLPVWRQVTGPLNVATVVGGHLGQGNVSVPFTVWIAVFDNSGTPQLALSVRSALLANAAATFYPLDESSPQNTVAMSAGATAIGTWYTSAGVTLTGKSFRILGRLDFTAGLATPGSFNAVPVTRLFGAGSKKPGEMLQSTCNASTTVSTTTSAAFAQLSASPIVALTPTNACTLTRIKVEGTASLSAFIGGLQIAKGAASPTVLIGLPLQLPASGLLPAFLYCYDQPGAAAVFYGYQGKIAGGTLSFPPASSGVMVEVEELQG
jgi:hypothetical protein